MISEEHSCVGVDGRKSEQQHGGYDEHSIASSEPDQQIVYGTFHLRPGEDYHRDDIPNDAQKSNDVQQHSVGDELEENFRLVHRILEVCSVEAVSVTGVVHFNVSRSRDVVDVGIKGGGEEHIREIHCDVCVSRWLESQLVVMARHGMLVTPTGPDRRIFCFTLSLALRLRIVMAGNLGPPLWGTRFRELRVSHRSQLRQRSFRAQV